MPETKEVCPVCGGRKLAYDTDRFEWGPEKCKACDGTGDPLWKLGPKKRGQAEDLRHLSAFMVRRTSSFPEYVRECRYAGLNPLKEENYLRMRVAASEEIAI